MITLSKDYLLDLIYYPFEYSDNFDSESIETISKTVNILLRLRDDIFWSNIVYDNGFRVFLDSYLKKFKRIDVDIDEENVVILREQKGLFGSMFHLMNRILTLGNSFSLKDTLMFYENQFDMLYDYKILTLPMLMDFISLYTRHTSLEPFGEMMELILEKQPIYRKDFQSSLIILNRTLKEFLSTVYDLSQHDMNALDSQNETQCLNVLSLIRDVTFSLDCFLRSCKSESYQLFSCKTFYYLSYMYDVLSGGILQSGRIDAYVRLALDHIKSLANVAIRNILEPVNCKDLYDISDLMAEMLQYFAFYDMERIQDEFINIEGSIHNKFTVFAVKNGLKDALNERFDLYNICKLQSKKYLRPEDLSNLGVEEVKSGVSNINPREFDKILASESISNIKGLFPHLGDGFIAIGLYEYGHDEEKFINDLLEQSLKSSISKYDKSLDARKAKDLLFAKVEKVNEDLLIKHTKGQDNKKTENIKGNKVQKNITMMLHSNQDNYEDEPDDSLDYFPGINTFTGEELHEAEGPITIESTTEENKTRRHSDRDTSNEGEKSDTGPKLHSGGHRGGNRGGNRGGQRGGQRGGGQRGGGKQQQSNNRGDEKPQDSQKKRNPNRGGHRGGNKSKKPQSE